MRKIIIITALLTSIASAYGWHLLDCRYDYSYNSLGGSYVGIYQNNQGEIIRMVFDSWCPYSL